jgi:hypothetical protein
MAGWLQQADSAGDWCRLPNPMFASTAIWCQPLDGDRM